jgi:hypothetical protein
MPIVVQYQTNQNTEAAQEHNIIPINYCVARIKGTLCCICTKMMNNNDAASQKQN